MATPALATVRVGARSHGAWEVSLPGRDGRISCPTLEDARRLAHATAERSHPCELIVCDAYHRVLEYEILGEQLDRAPARARIAAQ